MAKYFDPICYQLVFSAYSEQPQAELMRAWALDTINDLEPYILTYAQLAKPFDLVLFNSYAAQGLTPDTAAKYLQKFTNEVVEKDFRCFALDRIKKRPPKEFTFDLSRQEAKEMNDKVLLISPKFNTQPSIDKILALSNCPDPLLRSVAYPVTSAWTSFFTFNFTCMEVEHLNCYIHSAVIQLPRAILDHAGISFPFQEKWVAALKSACNCFKHAHGVIKMDMTASFYHPNIINGLARVDPVSSGVPGYGWGLCLSQEQANRLRQSNVFSSDHPFYAKEDLSHGGMYLQLTDDVNRVDRSANDSMINLLRPYLQEREEVEMDFLPNSCRLSLRPEDIIVKTHDYKILIP